MKTEQKIIVALINDKRPKTIREISKMIASDYKITHTAATRLLQKNILLSTSVGSSLLCQLNNSYFGEELYLAEYQRKEELLQNKDINQVYKEIMNKISSSFFVFLIFGSYAKGGANAHSDIDLLIISNQKNSEQTIRDACALLPLKIHLLVFSEKEFVRMKNDQSLNVVKEAIKNNIILFGTENYYKLKNA